jgi:hypothetical protein
MINYRNVRYLSVVVNKGINMIVINQDVLEMQHVICNQPRNLLRALIEQ